MVKPKPVCALSQSLPRGRLRTLCKEMVVLRHPPAQSSPAIAIQSVGRAVAGPVHRGQQRQAPPESLRQEAHLTRGGPA
jgi:hypothetical protein